MIFCYSLKVHITAFTLNNTFKTYKKIIILKFHFLPAFTLEARVHLVTSDPTAGSPLQLDCSVSGPSASEVTWRHGGEVVRESDRRRLLSNHTLLIAKAEEGDAGQYECRAEHGGSVASSSVAVSVKGNLKSRGIFKAFLCFATQLPRAEHRYTLLVQSSHSAQTASR